MSLLHWSVLLAGAWTILALAYLHSKAKRYGKRTLYSAPAGDPAEGVLYAFTKGMAPWAKESVMLNLPSYGAGMAFHAGVFTAFGLLLVALIGLELPSFLVFLARVIAVAGTLGGLSLLAKRAVKPQLRGLSSPDDFVSNLLSTLFVGLALARTFNPALDGLWMSEAILLLIYAPLGKIRHCFFFFTTRYHLGAFFGRRGTYPPQA
jgi:hypothetical protein